MPKTSFNNIIANNSRLIDQELKNKLERILNDTQYKKIETLEKSMRYSLLAGGKRLRPLLCCEFAKLFGTDFEFSKHYACAIEMVHCASLIHDDMPCVDDDIMRRGMPTNHIAFGETTALFAGDALVPLAFDVICDAPLSDEQNLEAVSILAKSSGACGMLGGQQIDHESEAKQVDIETLKVLHSKKTGALIKCACALGCIAAGKRDNTKEYNDALQYAELIGLAFQIADDILDVCGDEKKLGKPRGSDSKSNKSTYVSLLGIEKAKKLAFELCQQAKDTIRHYENSEFLCELADYIVLRDR